MLFRVTDCMINRKMKDKSLDDSYTVPLEKSYSDVEPYVFIMLKQIINHVNKNAMSLHKKASVKSNKNYNPNILNVY